MLPTKAWQQLFSLTGDNRSQHWRGYLQLYGRYIARKVSLLQSCLCFFKLTLTLGYTKKTKTKTEERVRKQLYKVAKDRPTD